MRSLTGLWSLPVGYAGCLTNPKDPPSLPLLELQLHAIYFLLLCGFSRSNVGPHACMPSILPTEVFPHPQPKYILKKKKLSV